MSTTEPTGPVGLPLDPPSVPLPSLHLPTESSLAAPAELSLAPPADPVVAGAADPGRGPDVRPVPPKAGPPVGNGRSGGTGRGQRTPQARRYAFRRS
ncbi:hypothetical protein [Micromonospora echinofusca]|uniref:Uncharacterized protein n=1 Tax=Micromonospora echinofusca TaxID=47858 RepID=A0ABS3W1D5_MICEH|nr:hypothetical protein [Micromonospora echinofusca]MBO4210493.1 hypothetical protein [Micromonospora echinofusca]